VVHEGNGVLVPASETFVELNADEIREPADVLDLLFLQFEVSVECTKVEGVFHGHRVSASSFLLLDFIELLFVALGLVSLVLNNQVHISEECFVGGAFNRILEFFLVRDVLQLFVAFGVEVAKVADELGAVGFTATGVTEISGTE